MQQYFVKGVAQSPFVVKDKDTIKHMFSVMRLAEGDEVVLVFDDQIKRLVRVLNKEEHSFEIIEELPDNLELPLQVTIASAFPKGDKLDFIAQKTTELGAYRIWGFPSDYSVVKWDSKKIAKKTEKLNKIVLGAAEQSQRNRVPQVKLFENKLDFLETFADFDRIVVAYEESAKQGEASALVQALKELKEKKKLLFIFGPEGGFSSAEIEMFRHSGAIAAGLGPRIMRTETAPLYALSAVSVLSELCPKE